MQKRLIIAIVLSFLVLLGFEFYYSKTFIPLKKQPVEQNEIEKPKDISLTPIASTEKIKKQELKSQLTLAATTKNLENTKDITLETKKVKAIFTNKGAKLKSFILKEFNENKHPVDLVSKELQENFPLKLDSIGNTDNQIWDASADKNIISFKTKSGDLTIIKKFSFDDNTYKVKLDIEISNLSKENQEIKDLTLLWGPGIIADKKDLLEISAVAFANNKVTSFKAHKIGEPKIISGNISWIGIKDKYFMASLAPENDIAQACKVERNSEGKLSIGVTLKQFVLGKNEQKNVSFVLYMGPLILEELRPLKIGLDKALDFGMFSWLGIWFLIILKFLYKLVPNWGVAIILLTVLIKLVLWIPTQKSYKSMKSMQKLQPQFKALKEQYKNNPQLLNQQTMKLYKENKVNPLGGCLPMLLQLPIFYALYTILVNAIELRSAPFVFWIHDLSLKDPSYVSPILMGVTMFVQQKMTPAADPQQAKIMLVLPVIFTVMFASLPAGVLLYWIIQNMLSIIQQYHINQSN